LSQSIGKYLHLWGIIMADYILISILSIGGLTGWILVFYILRQSVSTRKKEITLINEIRNDFNQIRKDLFNLK